MQIGELHSLLVWYDENVIKPNIKSKYQGLSSTLQQNANARNNQTKQPFDSHKQNLIEALSNVDFTELNHAQLNILESLGLTSSLGDTAIKRVEDILFRNNLDIVTASQKMTELLNEHNSNSATLEQLTAPLKNLVNKSNVELDSDELGANEALIRVRFQHDSSINDIDDLKDWSEKWHGISKGIAEALDLTSKDIHVVSANKGSIIVTLKAAFAVAGLLGSAIYGIMKGINAALEIKKKSKEIELLDMDIELKAKTIEMFEQDVAKKKEAIVESVANELIEKCALSTDNSQGDKITQLKRSVNELYKFIEGGGDIDTILHEDQAEHEDEADKLRHEIQQINKLSNNIKLLEHISSAEEELEPKD